MRVHMTSITGSWAIVSLFWAVTLRNVVPTATVVKDGIVLMVNVPVICVPLRLIAAVIAIVIMESAGILVAIRETATTMEWAIYANMDFVSVPLERNADIHILGNQNHSKDVYPLSINLQSVRCIVANSVHIKKKCYLLAFCVFHSCSFALSDDPQCRF